VRAGGGGFSDLVTWESSQSELGTCHAIEVPLVFGAFEVPGIDRFAGSGPLAAQLSRLRVEAWISFAPGDGPGLPALVGWPQSDARSRATWVFGPDSRCESAPREPERAAWGDLLGEGAGPNPWLSHAAGAARCEETP